MPLSPGDNLSHCEVLFRPGKSGRGEVYRARNTQSKRDIAMKVLPARFAARIQGPGIV